MSQTEKQDCEANLSNSSEDLLKSDDLTDKTVSHDDNEATSNGFEDVASSHAGSKKPTPPKKVRKRPPLQVDPLNVKDLEDLSTLAEGVQQKLGEPHITEHKTFKPEDPVYATFVKAPFIRPPPSTYLDESLLSMRKRRAPEEVVQKKNVYWSIKKKKDPELNKEQKVDNTAPEQKSRQRCDKCLSSFGSLEELKKHQALNTCSSLFGFDSDDES
ncbi:unnamed protein product [Pleuronectes platessa]|uniref:C2H2-type domain-containing protein n=1 Tax=Pleuronectes platessa TaxID=8262 RepID=A0A9N7VUS8_PLEPL|nr:unnamed protein product [Pleuronectes platessa]